MDINNITDSQLVEITKKPSNNELVFRLRNRKNIKLNFKGLMFETTYPAINRKVKHIELRRVLGFKGLTQLRHTGQDPKGYQQLLIQMGEENEDKIELICVFKTYKLEAL
jgi:hypothetical protein